MKRIFRLIFKSPFLIYLKLRQKEFRGINYLHYSRNSKTLAIVFSAFDRKDTRRSFNYVKSLSNIPIDFLYLSDPWGYRGSYYMMDYGSKRPIEDVQSLIDKIVSKGIYSKIITLGTSKGGTAALYYGLKNAVNQIVIGACQYRIGSYISAYPDIYRGMTGQDIKEQITFELNNIIPNELSRSDYPQTTIHLVHSKSEPTYDKDIKYLISDLNERGIRWIEYECGFKKHEDVGQFFIPVAKNILSHN